MWTALVDVTIEVDADAARALQSSARRQGAGRYKRCTALNPFADGNGDATPGADHRR
jgi:hypothetical protein